MENPLDPTGRLNLIIRQAGGLQPIDCGNGFFKFEWGTGSVVSVSRTTNATGP
jgi:hypothetical protein